MKTRFGFLLQSETFTAELPDDVERDFQLAATAGLSPAAPISIQCASRKQVDFSEFGWKKSFEANAGGMRIDVYKSDADPAATMPVWHLESSYIWMQLRGDTTESSSQLLATFVSGLRVDRDSWGMPRVRLHGGLVPGNPYTHTINRDHAIYQVRNTTQTIVFRNDGALASDGVSIEGDFASITVATPSGISVIYGGASSRRDALTSTAREIASSLRRIDR